MSSATNRFATRATSSAGASAQSPHKSAISTAAAASTASARAMANTRALSARETRPAPSASLDEPSRAQSRRPTVQAK